MEMLNFIKSRRSTRKFLQKPVETEKLNAVIEAGRYAPSGGNSQSTRFLVVKSPRVLNELAGLVQKEFAGMEVTPGMYRSKAASITASKAGTYRFHYNCPVLIITANKANYGNNIADCACALENMMLEANALDLGSVWINQLRWLNETPTLVAYLQRLGMEADERVYGALALGYADSADGLPVRSPLPRIGNPVVTIEE